MTTQSILEKVAKLIEIQVDFSQESDEKKRLLACAEYVLDELSTQYVTLRDQKTVAVGTDGKVRYSDLGNAVLKVLSVKIGGKKVRFCEYPTFFRVAERGEAEVVFTYAIRGVTLAGSIVLPQAVGENMLATGIAAEYLFRCGFEQDAERLYEKYLTALKNVVSVRKNIVLPQRGYLV